jgi:RNA polymerase sigma-70 factor (ECF subfamily)
VFRRRSREATSSPPVPSAILNPEAAREQRLIDAAKQGDLASFNVLVTMHVRAVYGLCFRMLREQMAAEDAAQDAFLKAWSSIGSFRGEAFRAWLLRIATNRCYDVIRAKGRRPADSLDALPFETEPFWTSQASGDEHPEQHVARAELSRCLEQALSALPDDQRLVIILSDIEERSYEEIAEIAGVAVGTVKSRLSRARAKLRESLRAQPEQRELLERFGRHYDD